MNAMPLAHPHELSPDLLAMSEKGAAKLDAALAWIDENPEKHYQEKWFMRTACGTTACLAGVIAILDGAEPEWMNEGESTQYVTYDGGQGYCTVSSYASRVLGIEHMGWLSRQLFFATSREDLRELREIIQVRHGDEDEA